MAGRGEFAIEVTGVEEVIRALKATDRQAARNFAAELRAIAGDLAKEAGKLFPEKIPLGAEGSPASATMFRPRTRTSGGVVSVEQYRRKVTGARPDYGALQMKYALLPAAQKLNPTLAPRVARAVEMAIFENGLAIGPESGRLGGFA